MKAGRITVSTRQFAMTEIAIPQTPAGHVRIAVKAAGVCLSDVHFLSGIISPAYLDGDVVTLGHEVAGVIDELGDGVHSWNLGDEVIVCAGVRDLFFRHRSPNPTASLRLLRPMLCRVIHRRL